MNCASRRPPWQNESPQRMNAAIQERKPATEEISGVISALLFHDENGFCVRHHSKGTAQKTKNRATLLRLPGAYHPSNVLLFTPGPCHRSSPAAAANPSPWCRGQAAGDQSRPRGFRPTLSGGQVRGSGGWLSGGSKE